jgi:MoaA/NifB/PqqE/SkfB family radical SAM enzyme
MVITIVIENKNVNEILDIVKELRDKGLVQGVHFDFAYNQSRWDPMIGDVKGFTNFTFYEEKYSTLFALKYLS